MVVKNRSFYLIDHVMFISVSIVFKVMFPRMENVVRKGYMLKHVRHNMNQTSANISYTLNG